MTGKKQTTNGEGRHVRLSKLGFLLNRELLRKLRQDRELKQFRAEVLSGLPGGKLTQYERGTVVAPIEHIRILANFYDTSIPELIDPGELATAQSILSEITKRTSSVEIS